MQRNQRHPHRNSYPYQKGRITIPVELVKLEDNSFHLTVKANINGTIGDMIIDTGASVTVADQHLFPDTGEDDTEINLQSGSVSGKIDDVRLIHIRHFSVGNYSIKNFRIAGINLDYVNDMYKKHLQRKIIGLLGCDFLAYYHACINYKERTLTISSKKHEIR